MSRDWFTEHVRPHLRIARVGVQGKVFDRLDLDQFAEQYMRRNGSRPVDQKGVTSWSQSRSRPRLRDGIWHINGVEQRMRGADLPKSTGTGDIARAIRIKEEVIRGRRARRLRWRLSSVEWQASMAFARRSRFGNWRQRTLKMLPPAARLRYRTKRAPGRTRSSHWRLANRGSVRRVSTPVKETCAASRYGPCAPGWN